MTAPTTISVRGEARGFVDPDAGELMVAVTATADQADAALASVGDALRALLAELTAVGGVARTAETTRAPLTWSAESARTEPEWHPTKGTESGRMVATVSLVVAVRDFALLDRVGAVLARPDGVRLQYASWSVDPDNAAWPAVRAAAIDDALARARDYAQALHGRLRRLEQLADSGLLDDGPAPGSSGGQVMFARAAAAGDSGAPPSLDPMPQQLYATVDARFAADVAELD